MTGPALRRTVALVLALSVAAAAWVYRAPLSQAARLATSGSPHDRYLLQLWLRGRGNAADVRAWRDAADLAFAAPVPTGLPLQTALPLGPGAAATGFALALRRGQRLDVRPGAPPGPGRVFLDLARLGETGEATIVGSAESPAALEHEVNADGRYVLRVHGSLEAAGQLALALTAGPSLQFPVEGADGRAIRSRFGVEREGGRRTHEGVDIFAARGTPVRSASHGIVTGVGENRLGGLVVWVWSPSRGLVFYYAHLDTQAARVGQRVVPGDLLGTVGTTGNARTTPPHLHFGIYAGADGAIDPAPFIADQDAARSRPVAR